MFLYRKAADRNYMPEELTPEERNSAEVHVAKHRNGPTGMVKLFWDAARTTFKNMDRQYEGTPAVPAAAPTPVAIGAGGVLAPAAPNPNIGLQPGAPPKGFAPRRP